MDVAGCTQFSNGEDFGAFTHPSTVVLERALIEPLASSDSGPRGR